MKSYTDIEQSKKLAEILPLESADMTYRPMMDIDSMSNSGFLDTPECFPFNDFKNSIIKPLPCWSLAALLIVLPNNEHITTSVSRGSWQIEPINYLPITWWCEYEDNESLTEFNVTADNPVDACYEMILKLNELKVL